MSPWFLILMMAVASPAESNGDAGAKAIYKDPYLNVLHFSRRTPVAKPPRKSGP